MAAPVSYEQPPMMYYPAQQPQYVMGHTQYYSPPTALPYSPQKKVSSKSSQNVAKLKRK